MYIHHANTTCPNQEQMQVDVVVQLWGLPCKLLPCTVTTVQQSCILHEVSRTSYMQQKLLKELLKNTFRYIT